MGSESSDSGGDVGSGSDVEGAVDFGADHSGFKYAFDKNNGAKSNATKKRKIEKEPQEEEEEEEEPQEEEEDEEPQEEEGEEEPQEEEEQYKHKQRPQGELNKQDTRTARKPKPKAFSFIKGLEMQAGGEGEAKQTPTPKCDPISGLPFVSALTKKQSAALEEAKEQGKVLLVYHKQELTFKMIERLLSGMDVQVPHIYRLHQFPFTQTNNVDSFFVCNSRESADKLAKAPLGMITGRFISDCREWLDKGHVVYVRGIPLSAPDAEIVGFFEKLCGPVSWISRIETTNQIGIHFKERKHVNSAMRFNKKGVQYNGVDVIVGFRVNKRNPWKKMDLKFTRSELRQLREAGKALYEK